jgi:vacuolar-type H+-ATPase subunit C/Vma6
MTRASSNDLDYLATRLHARRSRMAEGERLDELCRARSVPDLGRAIFPGAEISAVKDFQRRLAQALAGEISGCLKHLGADDQDFIAWLLARFQVENVKILLRGFLTRTPLADLQPRLVSLPADLALAAPALLAAKSLDGFAELLPAGRPRSRLRAVLAGPGKPQPFLLEAALDAGYFQELLARNSRLSGGESEIVKPLVSQETNLFQFLLVVRGRFHFGLTAETLLPLCVSGQGGVGWLNTVLSAPDVLSAAKAVVGIVIDGLPRGVGEVQSPKSKVEGRSGQGVRTLDFGPGTLDSRAAIEISTVETLAWQRYLRLANSAFRRSHNGVGAVAGYFGVRRLEVANLITLSESIRLGADERQTRARLLPRNDLEAAHV